eukprot:CAMPEP_0182420130 /NCGR_PEP_ID=MMETSP1167-20130531/4680_1 /TAXON_ID=2988 /ORGANISM="Mallomonas Sp, Strain CCMP3275" /LENGTH=446 /DNA_ID=CAMNT_0024595637 /DNA_START=327 /DNA_END=1667 /DNA_ORIENTATION=-
MVFDFIKKRSEEGINQFQNIATKSFEGKLGEALSDSALYVRERQRADKENWKKLTAGLSRSRDVLLSDLGGIFGASASMKGAAGGKGSLSDQLEQLEDVLLRADLGSVTTTAVLRDVREYSRSTGEGLGMQEVLAVLRSRLVQALTVPPEQRGLNLIGTTPGEPAVMLVIGANGMGKTTTIGKLAYRIRSELNQTVLLGACDTFRAAAVTQLQQWAVRANVSIECPTPEEEGGGDPVSVARRTLQRGKAEGFDIVILDTSGRLSNNYALTLQLQEIRDMVQQEVLGGPHETLLVVDGSVGRNAVLQAETWRSKVGVTGLAVTKLDGTARGGFVVSVVRDLKLPVKLVGVGEGIEDLRDFSPELFVDALLGNTEADAQKMREKANDMLTSSDGSDDGSPSTSSTELSAAERLRASFGESSGSAEVAKSSRKAVKRVKSKKRQQKSKR